MEAGPRDPARAPFPVEFTFPSGSVCRNFDQLALTCNERWDEAWQLLQGGQLKAFLTRLGRADLVAAANEAVRRGPDEGVDLFLARLPSPSLMPPRLSAAPAEIDLGEVRPGRNRDLNIRLANLGHRLIVATVSTDSPWLQIEETPPGQAHAVRFRNETTLRVRLRGDRLPAGKAPRTGRIIVQSDAGEAEVTIRCVVPIVPFPHGVLAGARTPRELADKARTAAREAAELFTSGAVRTWYRNNGWTYPIEGSDATGLAAVQQYFDALGVSAPPRVLLDTTALTFVGTPGQRLTQAVQLHAEKARLVYAVASSDSPWLHVAGSASKGSRAVVKVVAVVPADAEGDLDAVLEVRANGNQLFRVPVSLRVEYPASDFEVVEEFRGSTRPRAARKSRVWSSCLGCLMIFALLLVLSGAGAAGLFWWWSRSPVEAYATAIPPGAKGACFVDLRAADDIPGLSADVKALQGRIAGLLRDLDLRPTEARMTRLFLALKPDEPPLLVLTFTDAVEFGTVAPGHYEIEGEADKRICKDRLNPNRAWTIDARGRLISGTPEAVRACLARERSGQPSAAYEEIVHLTRGQRAPFWAVGTFGPRGVLGTDALARAIEFRAEIVPGGTNKLTLHGTGTFRSTGDAAEGREQLRRDVSAAADAPLHGVAWRSRDSELLVESDLSVAAVATLLLRAARDVETASGQAQATLEKRCAEMCVPGFAALKAGEYAKAATLLERVLALYPHNESAKARHAEAQRLLAEKTDYENKLRAARDALTSGQFDTVRSASAQLRKSRFADTRINDLVRDLEEQERLVALRVALEKARSCLENGELKEALEQFSRARTLARNTKAYSTEITAIGLLQEVKKELDRGGQFILEGKASEAYDAVVPSLRRLLDVGSDATWRADPLKRRRELMLRAGLQTCLQARQALIRAGDTVRLEGDARVQRAQYGDARAKYDAAKELYDRARGTLDPLKALGADEKETNAAATALDQRLAGLQKSSRDTRGLELLDKGGKTLTKANLALIGWRRAPGTLMPAIDELDAALKQFEEAGKLGRAEAADRAGETRRLRARMLHCLRPVTLDPARGAVKGELIARKKQWMSVELDKKSWLKALPVKRAALHTIGDDWPEEYELTLEFALIDPKGEINNSFWKYYRDPLTLTLHTTSGADTVIVLGKDPRIMGQAAAHLQVGPLDRGADRLLGKNEPLRLVLRHSKRSLSVQFNGTDLGTIDCPVAHKGLSLYAANPYNETFGRYAALVAISALEVRWAGLAGPAEK